MPAQIGQANQALARSVLCRTLKLGLRPPTASTASVLFSEEGRQALEQAARLLETAGPFRLGQAVESLFRCRRSSLSDLETSYNRLFGHALRGRVCPYETEYAPTGPFQQSQGLADIAAFYRGFGLEPQGAERLDHIGVELDFVEFLSVKEAYALELRDREMLEVTQDALKSFLRQHLGRFGRAFGETLAREAGEGFYGALGALCEVFLSAECARAGVPVGPQVLELSPEEPDSIPMACGSPSDLVQIDAEEPA